MEGILIEGDIEGKTVSDRTVYGNCVNCYAYGFPCSDTCYYYTHAIRIMSFQEFLNIANYEPVVALRFLLFPNNYIRFLNLPDIRIYSRDREFLAHNSEINQ